MIEIRGAHFKDASGIAAIAFEIQVSHAQAYPSEFRPPQRKNVWLWTLRILFNSPTMFVVVAIDDQTDEVVGFVSGMYRRRASGFYKTRLEFLYVDHIAVRASHRRARVGTQLLARVREIAKELGVSRIALDTWGFNTSAHEFFRAEKFEIYRIYMWSELDH